jgi:hypothetical protein
MAEENKLYKGNEHLNKHQLYHDLTPDSKQRVERMMYTVVKNWTDGRATTTSEIEQVAGPNPLFYSRRSPERPFDHKHATTLLKELLPYIPVRAGRLFSKTSSGKVAIKDQDMHENLREGFAHAKTKYSRGATRFSTHAIIESLNNPESEKSREVLFFPNFAVGKVSTKPFLEKLGKIHDGRLEEWFLGKGPDEPMQMPLVRWERKETLKLILRKDKNVTSSHSRSKLPWEAGARPKSRNSSSRTARAP